MAAACSRGRMRLSSFFTFRDGQHTLRILPFLLIVLIRMCLVPWLERVYSFHGYIVAQRIDVPNMVGDRAQRPGFARQ